MPTFPGFISEQNSGGLIIRDLELEPLAKARKSKSIVVWFLTISVLILVAVVGVQYYRTGTFSALVVIPIGFASIIVGEFSKLSKMSKELKRRAAEQ